MAKGKRRTSQAKPQTKTAAIRLAFETLGGLDTPTHDVVGYVRDQLRMPVKSSDVSQWRSNERARLRKSKEGQPAIPGLVASDSAPRETTSSPAAVNPAEVILAVKDAARRVGGMDQLKAIIQALEH